MKIRKIRHSISILFLSVASYVCAQNGYPVDTIKEGNLIYIKQEKLVWKAGTEHLRGKSHLLFSPVVSPEENFKKVIKPLFQSIFSPERAKELENTIMTAIVKYDTVEEKVIKISYFWNVKEFPLKLSELEKIEQKIKAEPNFVGYKGNGEKVIDIPMSISIKIDFKDLYD